MVWLLRGVGWLAAQSAIERASDSPNFWPLTFAGLILSVVLSTWTLLGRISARFDKALDAKLGPLADQIRAQGERFESETKRLETHFNAAIAEYEQNARGEITSIANSIRSELRGAIEKHNELALAVNTNRANVEQHTRELHESKVDRTGLHREMDAVRNSLAGLEGAHRRTEEKILDAIEKSRERLETKQNDLGSRTTRVEEALKFYARVRTEDK